MSQNQSLNTKTIFLFFFFSPISKNVSLYFTACIRQLQESDFRQIIFATWNHRSARDSLTTWDYPNSQKGRLNEPCTIKAPTYSGLLYGHSCFKSKMAGLRSAVGRAPDLLVRGPRFDTRSGLILLFLLPLIQDGQLSVTGEVCTRSTG